MEISKTNAVDKGCVDMSRKETTNIYKDEINLIDYFLVLWKHKWLILFGSVLPVLVTALIAFSIPRNYKATYVYDVEGYQQPDIGNWKLDFEESGIVTDLIVFSIPKNYKATYVYDVEGYQQPDIGDWKLDFKEYKILLESFYSVANLDRVTDKLSEKGLVGFVKKIEDDFLENFVIIGVSPPFANFEKMAITNPVQIKRFTEQKATLLNMTVIGSPKKDFPKIALVIRENFENVVPLYMINKRIKAIIREIKTKMSNIEKGRLNDKIKLDKHKGVLRKLNGIDDVKRDIVESSMTIQLEISEETGYMPIAYRINATESQIIIFEEEMAAKEAHYILYKDLLRLNEKLVSELNSNLSSSYYTLRQFQSFLKGLAKSEEDQIVKNYLSTYIKEIENRISISGPVTEKPKIYAVAKGVAKKSGIVLAISVMISIFVAFLLEGLKKSQAQAS